MILTHSRVLVYVTKSRCFGANILEKNITYSSFNFKPNVAFGRVLKIISAAVSESWDIIMH